MLCARKLMLMLMLMMSCCAAVVHIGYKSACAMSFGSPARNPFHLVVLVMLPELARFVLVTTNVNVFDC